MKGKNIKKDKKKYLLFKYMVEIYIMFSVLIFTLIYLLTFILQKGNNDNELIYL